MLLDVLHFLGELVISEAKEHPTATFLALLALARAFGTQIETGSKGVLFRFGRAQREIEPGFHFLTPIVEHVRKMRVRSASIDLPPQHVTTRDGLVYLVDANIVYHVEDPMTAAVQIDDLRQGLEVIGALVVAELMGNQTTESLGDRRHLDQLLWARLRTKAAAWGVEIDHAGLRSIAPTSQTLRLTQLGPRIAERHAVWRQLSENGLSCRTSLALLGAQTRLVGHSLLRYGHFVRIGRGGRRTAAESPHEEQGTQSHRRRRSARRIMRSRPARPGDRQSQVRGDVAPAPSGSVPLGKRETENMNAGD